MSNPQHEDRPFRVLFTEQARRERQKAPGFEETVQRVHGRPRMYAMRLAIAAGVLLIVGVSVVMYRGSGRGPERIEPQAALPNLLESLDDGAMSPWQSPTAFLLDVSTAQSPAESAPAPGGKTNENEHLTG